MILLRNINIFKDIIASQHQGIPQGICSICSANKFVIQAAMEMNKNKGLVLIESTCNQVNQYGGYTGKSPSEFKDFVHDLARKIDFPVEDIILGGDHLGPIPWKKDNYTKAYDNAKEMIKQYIKAGYRKIHLDASIPLEDDRDNQLPFKVIAERTVELCQAAEKTYHNNSTDEKQDIRPVYIIGTEVPYPGGSQENEEVTKINDFHKTINLTKRAFIENNLDNVWNNVIGVVVNPGIEFGSDAIKKYDSDKFKEIKNSLENYRSLIFEGHSTDFQPPQLLKKMVEDKIAILKVGPALTFAVREAIFALAMIEEELLKYDNDRAVSNFIDILDMVMIDNDEHWREYFSGKEKNIKLYRKFSYFDRSRYYFSHPDVRKALEKLIANLKTINISAPVLSQYLPNQYKKVKKGQMNMTPEELIKGKVKDVLKEYYKAITPPEVTTGSISN